MKKAYTYEEAAAQLGVEKSLIRQLVADGELVAFTVSADPNARSHRISDAELDRFIATREGRQAQRFADIALTAQAQAH
ncbi:excisionase family DNA-binding protein [Deinococcus lacus]|uniref:Excisionase family DNA-binding protein n=1 Tax=Deinococcus lacus TaxID=392561 RepID=A0ABW1YFS4_9DEIO